MRSVFSSYLMHKTFSFVYQRIEINQSFIYNDIIFLIFYITILMKSVKLKITTVRLFQNPHFSYFSVEY